MDIRKLLESSERVVLTGYQRRGGLWEKVVLASHKEESNSRIIPFGIFIHDRTLGRALGGLRMRPDYPSFREFFEDGLLLSEGMTYKASLAGLDLGGGKAVIWGNPKTEKTDGLLKRVGREINKLRGAYITAEDMGTKTVDMEVIAAETKWVVGRAESSGGSGDPSPITALGTLQGIKACLYFLYNSSVVYGRTFAIQGVGNCGFRLARALDQEGGKLIVCDIDEEMTMRAVSEFGAKVVKPEEIYDEDCDVFVPCAAGGILNDETIPRLRCQIVAGTANNQLADEDRHGKMLYSRGIIYAPDYAINAGGLINVSHELNPGGYDAWRARFQTMRIYQIILKILQQSQKEDVPPHIIASREAKQRIEMVRSSKKAVEDLWG